MAQSSALGATVVTVIAIFAVGGCSEGRRQSAETEVQQKIEERAGEIQGGSYQDTFGNEGCSSDCSGHEAGWAWAREHEISDEADCSSHGDSTGSFAEGCKAYVNADSQAENDVKDDEQ